MITVTEGAARKIEELLEREGNSTDGLRIKVVGGGCSGMMYEMGFEGEPGAEDSTVESNGVKVFVDPKSATYLAGCELSYEDGLMGGGFQVKNPNATAQCGCGESFCV